MLALVGLPSAPASAQPFVQSAEAKVSFSDATRTDLDSLISGLQGDSLATGGAPQGSNQLVAASENAPGLSAAAERIESPRAERRTVLNIERPLVPGFATRTEDAPDADSVEHPPAHRLAPVPSEPPVVKKRVVQPLYAYQVRAAVDAAWNEPAGTTRQLLAASSFALARTLSERSDSLDARELLVRSQALYEHYHGGIAGSELSPAEWAALRADALEAATAWIEGRTTDRTESDPIDPIDLLEMARYVAPSASETEHVDPSAAPISGETPGLTRSSGRLTGPTHLLVPEHAELLVLEQVGIAQRHLSGLGRRTRRYFPMIERTLARRGLPEDLKYVAVIESALNPNAESHAGAAGLWQFMPETGAEFGLDSLTVLDPARATDAAARLLKRLHRQFRGDWQLALAAYNSGSGRVSRLVRSFQSDNGRYPSFWDIHADLPRETQDYVPRFIAVTRMFEPSETL